MKIDASRAFGFVAFENCEDAATALASFPKSMAEDDATRDVPQQGLYVVKCLKKEDRKTALLKDTLKFMKDLARNNLYFKGFPTNDEGTSIADLTTELKTFFEKFGEVKSLKLMQRSVEVEGATKDELLGFGYVSFQTLESAQKARFDVNKESFRGAYKIYAN